MSSKRLRPEGASDTGAVALEYALLLMLIFALLIISVETIGLATQGNMAGAISIFVH